MPRRVRQLSLMSLTALLLVVKLNSLPLIFVESTPMLSLSYIGTKNTYCPSHLSEGRVP